MGQQIALNVHPHISAQKGLRNAKKTAMLLTMSSMTQRNVHTVFLVSFLQTPLLQMRLNVRVVPLDIFVHMNMAIFVYRAKTV